MLSLSVIFTAAISVFSAENFDDDGNRDNDAGLSDEEQNVLIQDSHPKHELDNPDDAYKAFPLTRQRAESFEGII